jgi:3-oxoacyl-[acyl-carrier protein] reductase
MVNAHTSEDAAKETVGLIEGAGGKAAYYLADVSDPAAVDAMFADTIDRFGRLDLLVNNHTLRARAPFDEMTFEQWRKVTSVILDGVFLCCRAAVPHMKQAGSGAIVNIGGQAAHQGARHSAHVGAGKLGVVGLTKAMALDLAPYDITVNCVVPFVIDTLRDDGGLVHANATTPLGRLGRKEEIAAMVRMLCGPDVRYITGQTIFMNGGTLMP